MIAFTDELLDGQLLRTMGHTTYGGAEIGECLAVAARIRGRDRESWYREWTALAERTSAAAEASAAAGHTVSAAHAFLRASNYFRNAYIFHLERPLPEAAIAAYRRHREAFGRAAALLPRPAERLAIPFEGSSLPGYFFSAGEGLRPLVVSVGGYDSTAEESYFFNAAPALDRGYHAVVFDGPGQGELLIERGVPFRPDWEQPLAAVLDAIAARPDVDPARIVIIGESFGGYLAPRAAARDPRIAACVLDPAQIGLGRAMLARIPLPPSLKANLPRGPRWVVALLRALLSRAARHPTRGWALRRGMLTHDVATPWDYVVETMRYEQEETIGDIRCPTLVCDAAEDDISAFTKPFYDLLRCEKTYLRFTAEDGSGAHCVSGNRAVLHERVFDWLDQQLRVPVV
jgi:alpha-beta hydrolase superfamily lysophospholipase